MTFWLDLYCSEARKNARGRRPRLTSGRLVVRTEDPVLIAEVVKGLRLNLRLRRDVPDEYLDRKFPERFEEARAVLDSEISAKAVRSRNYSSIMEACGEVVDLDLMDEDLEEYPAG